MKQIRMKLIHSSKFRILAQTVSAKAVIFLCLQQARPHFRDDTPNE